MSGGTGQTVNHNDYDNIRNKVLAILGTGSGPSGYGQTVQSSYVDTGDTITKAAWDALRYDLINIGVHQTGIAPTIIQVTTSTPIVYGAGNPNTDYDTLATGFAATPYSIGTGQFTIANKGTQSSTGAWYTQATATLIATFSTSDQARYFFNSGGQIQMSITRTGGSSTPRNGAWSNLLNQAGAQGIGAANGYYSLTTTYSSFYHLNSTTPYSNNSIELFAKCNVSNNTNGTATQVTLKAVLTDYITPAEAGVGDLVDGTLTFYAQELKAAGALVPTGTFTIASPTYTLAIVSVV